MKMTFQKLVIGASMAIGVSAIATVPAQAGTLTGLLLQAQQQAINWYMMCQVTALYWCQIPR